MFQSRISFIASGVVNHVFHLAYISDDYEYFFRPRDRRVKQVSGIKQFGSLEKRQYDRVKFAALRFMNGYCVSGFEFFYLRGIDRVCVKSVVKSDRKRFGARVYFFYRSYVPVENAVSGFSPTRS